MIAVRTAIKMAGALSAANSVIICGEIWMLRANLCDDGLFSWRVNRLSHPMTTRFLSNLGIDRVFEYPGVLGLLLLRAATALAVIITVCTGRSSVIPLFVLTVLALGFHLRNSSSNDGSDQYTLIILVACTLSELIHSQNAYAAAAFFIAGQSMLAYSVSGWLKIFQRGWRDGSFAKGILETSSFGNRALLVWFRRYPAISVLGGIAVCGGDCLLGIAGVIPPSITMLVLAFGVVLHFGIARVLGLNTFVLAFCATYPCVYYFSTALYSRIFSRLFD